MATFLLLWALSSDFIATAARNLLSSEGTTGDGRLTFTRTRPSEPSKVPTGQGHTPGDIEKFVEVGIDEHQTACACTRPRYALLQRLLFCSFTIMAPYTKTQGHLAKLADSGVATKQRGLAEVSVVGTPYGTSRPLHSR